MSTDTKLLAISNGFARVMSELASKPKPPAIVTMTPTTDVLMQMALRPDVAAFASETLFGRSVLVTVSWL